MFEMEPFPDPSNAVKSPVLPPTVLLAVAKFIELKVLDGASAARACSCF